MSLIEVINNLTLSFSYLFLTFPHLSLSATPFSRHFHFFSKILSFEIFMLSSEHFTPILAKRLLRPFQYHMLLVISILASHMVLMHRLVYYLINYMLPLHFRCSNWDTLFHIVQLVSFFEPVFSQLLMEFFSHKPVSASNSNDVCSYI